jgi:hypothetical protein
MKAVTALHHLVIGMATEFRSKKFRGIDSEWFPLFRGRKWSFPGIPRFTKEPSPKVGTEGNDMKKIGFAKNPAPANRIDSMFLSKTCYRM